MQTPVYSTPHFYHHTIPTVGALLLVLPLFLSGQVLPKTLYFNTVQNIQTHRYAGAFPDSRGYIWFGTQSGLFRYDGKNIKAYKPDLHNSNSLSYAWIVDLIEDKNGKLWISTRGGGLNSYDIFKDKWEHFYFEQNDSTSLLTNSPQWLALDEEGMIWIKFVGHGGIGCFNPDTGKCKRFIPQPGKAGHLQGEASGKLVALGQRIYISTSMGLEYFNKETGSFSHIPFINEKGDIIPYKIYPAVGKSKDGIIWVTTPDNKLGFYDQNSQSIRYFPLQNDVKPFSHPIAEIEEDQQGNLLLCNWWEFWSLSNERRQLREHQFESIETLQRIDNHTEYRIAIDKTGMIWSGNNYYDPRKKIFDFYEVFSEGEKQRSQTWLVKRINASRVLVETPDGDFTYHLKERKGTPVTTKPIVRLIKDGKPYDLFIMSYDYDREGNLWITTWGQGLIRVKKQTLANNGTPIRNFDQWLADGSLSLIPTNYLKSVHVDSHNDLWICGNEGGVTRLNANTLQSTQFDYQKRENSISDFYTFHAMEDDDGNIWITTKSGGVNKFDRKTEKFKVFNVKGQMIGIDQFRIEKDTEGWLWFNSSIGLSAIDPATEQIRHYTQHDGLVSWEHGLTIDHSTNSLFLAGNLGFQIIDIDDLKNRPTYSSPIRINEVQIYNAKEKTSQSLRPIDWEKQTLHLSHQENNLTIEYAILDARNSSKHEYLYSFTSDKTPDWISNDNNTRVSLNRLRSGTYYFHIKGCNSDKIWTELAQPLKIIVHPPWWQTEWAYLLYVLIISGTVYYFYRFNLSRQLAKQEATQIKALNQLKSRFYTNITHEFRTPLTVILGMNQEKDNPKAQDLIERNGKKMLQLISQLLNLSKIDTGNLNVHYQQIEIVSFTQYIGESFQSLAEQKYIRLTIYSEIKQLYMDMDEEKYSQIISNLLSNAIKFTPESGKIILHLSQKENRLLVKVTDNGIGISPEALPHIFDRFYQVENVASRQGKGTGIGLALVKELVQLMDGAISAESEDRAGTTFSLQFPIRQTASRKSTNYQDIALNHSIVDEVEVLTLEQNTELPLLLIIEDNADVVIYIQSLLSRQYEILIAANGEEGIEKAMEHSPDIIISDVMMPKKNGFEVVETLKQDIRTSHIPIILLTAKATQEDKLEGLKYGADAYLMKPFDKQELFIRLKNLIEVRQQLRQKYATFQPRLHPPTNPEEEFLQQVHQQIEANYIETEFSVETLAKSLHMSRVQLYRKLKAISDQTPSQLIRTFRLEKASVLLADKKLNISEIAYEVGYSDPNYFIRQFTKVYKQSPNTFRKSL